MFRRRWTWPLLSALGLAASCARPVTNDLAVKEFEKAEAGQPVRPTTDGVAAATPDDRANETWEVIYLGDAKVGYIHTVFTMIEEDGRPLRQAVVTTRFDAQRFGQQVGMQTRTSWDETADGRLIRFAANGMQGAAPAHYDGQIVDDNLEVVGTVGSERSTTLLPWSDDIGGFDADRKSLLAKPITEGETRTIRQLEPPALDAPSVITVELRGGATELIDVAGRRRSLRRVEVIHHMPGGVKLPATLWTDNEGEVWRMSVTPQMSIVRTTRENALAAAPKDSPANLDLGLDMLVRLKSPPGDLHHARRATYRVHLQGGDVGAEFERSPGQKVLPDENPDTATIVVTAMRPEFITGSMRDADPPTEADRQPNARVQSDDPLIRKLAAEAVAGANTDWQMAVALERFVRGYMRQASFAQALASAAEVAQSREGDCTEYAVLLAALARTQGLPARLAVGLVYLRSSGNGAFGFHMWTEIYIDGVWLPFDGTLGMGGIGAGHLKLSHTSLGEGTTLSGFLPVMQVLGRLEIEVVNMEPTSGTPK